MTKNDILEAAAQVFSAKGYHAASMQDIADSVHLQKASLYHHISSKQEILLALLDQALTLLIEQLREALRPQRQPEEQLRHAVRAYLEVLGKNRDLASVLLFEHRSLEPDLQVRHIPHRDEFESLWRELIKGGAESGRFVAVDPSLTAKALLGVLNWTMTWYRPQGPLSIQEIADSTTDLFLNGLLPRSPDG